MEKKNVFLLKHYWVLVLIHIINIMFTGATNNTITLEQTLVDSGGDFAWSSWGTWTPCSRSCGGGVAIQERECLPRKRTSTPNVTLSAPEPAVRVTRQTTGECSGVSRRYHECNTTPCSGGIKDLRAEQCGVYDRRPFRGRFYTWVPYIDGDSPCTLNCRPLGQQFYASLAVVADGTPCTRPGSRAICVQGSCKVVGRDTVLATTGSRDVRCGRRLVSGLFSRPRLPLGYSYVTTVPRGACRLNVSEIVSNENYIVFYGKQSVLPSSSAVRLLLREHCAKSYACRLNVHEIVSNENYIALKISNGSYIMNGEFAISAPGTYEAVGSRFIYTRSAGLDSVFAAGPLHQPVDIMILYTQPNPSIKYEYFTESSVGEKDIDSITNTNFPEIKPNLPKHTRRHHSFDSYRPGIGIPRFQDTESKEASAEEGLENVIGSRRFAWKILSYTQCTRTCGGGIQLGKFRCVETTAGIDREISPIHCTGAAPAGRRRRCGSIPCPPRWRAAAWSTCPECGPAMRTRIVGCVQDHARGITKVSDQKCTAVRPATTESCDIPNCEAKPEKRVIRPREHTDHFRDGPVYTVAANSSYIDIGPEYTFNVAAGWLYTEWTECVGWHVGGGVQTRGVRCADPSGCAPMKAPETSRPCTPKFEGEQHAGHWFTGDWSTCTSSCKGKQVRGVLCIGNNGRHVREAACKDPKPEHERDCEGECAETWYFSDWGRCTGNCSSNTGTQRRTVVCSKDDVVAANDLECAGTKPGNQQECDLGCPPKIIPPDITIEAQKSSVFEPLTTTTTSTTTTTMKPVFEKQPKDCEDKLNNCSLAVQARLCHYNYYVQNCCHSCRGR